MSYPHKSRSPHASAVGVSHPFIGSGTTALACRQLSRHFIGFEIDKEYYAIAKARLGSMPKSLDYFVNKKEE